MIPATGGHADGGEDAAVKRSGRSFVLIGAGSAIGACLARRLSARGAALWLAGRNEAALARVADATGGRMTIANAASFSDMEACFDAALRQFGRIDGAVNCAGSLLLKPADRTSADEFEQVVTANLASAFATVRSAAAVMRETGGSIALISSAAARVGMPNHDAIAAAKAGVIGLTLPAAATYAPRGIRVNEVAPGLTNTPMTRSITSNETALRVSQAMHALGRIGEPDEVAAAIEWLLGPESQWVTG